MSTQFQLEHINFLLKEAERRVAQEDARIAKYSQACRMLRRESHCLDPMAPVTTTNTSQVMSAAKEIFQRANPKIQDTTAARFSAHDLEAVKEAKNLLDIALASKEQYKQQI